jgi:hypothetical protein
MAMIIPITTNTMIATCVQIQNGDMAETAYFGRFGGPSGPLTGSICGRIEPRPVW